MKRLLPLLSLCACNPVDDAAQCMFTPEHGAVGACLLPDGADAMVDVTSLEALDLVGAVVVGAGSGSPDSGCVELDQWLGLQDRAVDSATASWLTLEDAQGDRWTLALMAPEGALHLATGTPVDLRWRWTPGQALDAELRSTDGALLAWVGRALEPDQLGLPDELLVEEGDRIQACAEDCGVIRYAEVHAELADESLELGWEQTGRLGDYLLSHAGTAIAEDAACLGTGCSMGTALGLLPSN